MVGGDCADASCHFGAAEARQLIGMNLKLETLTGCGCEYSFRLLDGVIPRIAEDIAERCQRSLGDTRDHLLDDLRDIHLSIAPMLRWDVVRSEECRDQGHRLLSVQLRNCLQQLDLILRIEPISALCLHRRRAMPQSAPNERPAL